MKRIVLVRHGESVWNKENRFTGWTDVDLSPKGMEEAVEAGKLLKAEGFTFGKAYTSYLKRAVKTLNNILDQMDLDWIPVEKSWRLNEKHYGNLQGRHGFLGSRYVNVIEPVAPAADRSQQQDAEDDSFQCTFSHNLANLRIIPLFLREFVYFCSLKRILNNTWQ